MTRSFTQLLDDYDGGRISRRQLLQALAAVAIAVPGTAFAQDAGGGRGQAAAPRDTTPLVPPFEPTGWKTVWLDHLNYQCVDYRKAAAFYATLHGMEGPQRRRQAGGARHRRELGRHHHSRRVDRAAAGRDHRRRTRREPSAGAAQCSTDSPGASTPWDTDKVKAELEKRGLNPSPIITGPTTRASA